MRPWRSGSATDRSNGSGCTDAGRTSRLSASSIEKRPGAQLSKQGARGFGSWSRGLWVASLVIHAARRHAKCTGQTRQELYAACPNDRPNHVGIAVQRHIRAGRIQERDGRFYATSPAAEQTRDSLNRNLATVASKFNIGPERR